MLYKHTHTTNIICLVYVSDEESPNSKYILNDEILNNNIILNDVIIAIKNSLIDCSKRIFNRQQ